MSMYAFLRKVISHFLNAIYQPFLFALVLSVFVMFFIMYLEKYKNIRVKDRILNGLKDWINNFKQSVKFRRIFYFVFIVVMILFKTLLVRNMEFNPTRNVVGVWGFYRHDGSFTTEVVENVVLFIPFIFFMFFMLETTSKKATKLLVVIGRSIVISFLSSLTIEMLQLFLHLGTWQLSDLCFNTLGGIIGGFIYWITTLMRRSAKGE
ncbi:MAG: VanZ family protein [Eubacterium sp.]|nr:VanZ family protein [Eubacterium sp.]